MPKERLATIEDVKQEAFQTRRRITEIILHHTWRPRTEDYRGIETVRAVRRYHMQQRGWSDNGYHIMIGPSGDVFLCRPMNRIGAHCRGHNARSIGLSYIADFDEQDPATYKGLATGQKVVAMLLKRFGLGVEDVFFHRDFANKSCPGARMDRAQYREAVRGFMDGSPKIVLLPGSTVIDCNPAIEDGVTRCDLRSLAEALGAEVYTEHLKEQNKIYLRRKMNVAVSEEV